MTDELNTIFGIDLGTTYSCIAYVDEAGRPVVVPNAENERTTPSVVYFPGGDKIVVGMVAKEHSEIFPDQVAMLFKRDMGDPAYLFQVGESKYRPEELSSYVLKKVVEDAAKQTRKTIKDVVITCPAWFGEVQRQATQKAGEISGLTVRKILNEPTAAAIAYGMQAARDETVMVYDLGGGTFDVTIIDITENVIRVICTGGNHKLGGRNWDEAIVRYLLEQAREQIGGDGEMHQDRELLQELYLRAERAKQTLGRVDTTKVPVNYKGEKARVDLSREKFDEITNELLESTISLTRQLLDEVVEKRKTMDGDVNRGFSKILLVGGSTKMPQVKSRLEREFGVKCEEYDQDEAVARGAAIYGHKLAIDDEIKYELEQLAGPAEPTKNEAATPEPTSEQVEEAKDKVKKKFRLTSSDTKNVVIVDVASHTFGIAVMDESDKMVIMNMIRRSTELPAMHTHDCGLVAAGQREVDLKLVENDSVEDFSQEAESKEILLGTLELPPGLPADAIVRVTFKLNIDGILEVEAKELSSGTSVQLRAETKSVMTEAELEAAKVRNRNLRVTAG